MPATLNAPRPYSFGRSKPGPDWPSVGISIALTGALFSAALLSMHTILIFTGRDAKAPRPVMVPLSPPRPAPRQVPPPPAPALKTIVETPKPTSTVPLAPTAAAPISAPNAATSAIPKPVTKTDSGIGVDKRALSAKPSTQPRGAPIAPSGVSSSSPDARAAADPIYRALYPRVVLEGIGDAARKPPTGQELADQQLAQRQAEELARRSTTAGNARDVHVPTGAGATNDGNGGLGAGGSIPLPFLSLGPSRAQRARDEKIDADNRARLGRLAALIQVRRDSARADSLRLDSLRRRNARRDSVDRLR